MLIYKITNKLNNKCYIGQTIKSAEERWKEHQSHAFGTHINDINKTLYKAIRKYGLENFTFEVLQDNIETFEQLDKAEIYWIDYYNSFVKGYNETFGGQQYHKILPNKEIIEDYYKTRSARKTALNFGIDHSTVDNILNQNNIPRFSFRQATGQRIMISKDDFYKEFYLHHFHAYQKHVFDVLSISLQLFLLFDQYSIYYLFYLLFYRLTFQ